MQSVPTQTATAAACASMLGKSTDSPRISSHACMPFAQHTSLSIMIDLVDISVMAFVNT